MARLISPSVWKVILFAFFTWRLEAQVVNGDFETPVVSGPYQNFSGSQIPGWDIFVGNVDIVNMAQFSSSQILELNGDRNGSIRQTVNTVTGMQYWLSVEWQPDTLGGAVDMVANMAWNGNVNTAVLGFGHLETPGPRVTTVVVTAVGNDELSFIGANPGPQGIMIDNVALQIIPEAQAFPLVASGAMLLAAFWRKVSKRVE